MYQVSGNNNLGMHTKEPEGGQLLASQNRICSEEDVQEKLETLRQLVAGEERLKIETSDNFLMKFLWGADLDAEQAFRRITKFYHGRYQYPRYFCKKSPLDYLELFKLNIYGILKNRDKDGRLIGVVRQANADPSQLSFEEVCQLEDIFLHIFLDDEASARTGGGVVIMDSSGVRWQILKWFAPRNIIFYTKKFELVPLQKTECHCIFTPAFLRGPIAYGWSLMSHLEIANNMFFHYHDIGSLHKHIDPDILPVGLGGKLEDSSAYADIQDIVVEKMDRLEEMMSYGYQNR